MSAEQPPQNMHLPAPKLSRKSSVFRRLVIWFFHKCGVPVIVAGTIIFMAGVVPIGPFSEFARSNVLYSSYYRSLQMCFQMLALACGGNLLVLWQMWNTARVRKASMLDGMKRMWPIVLRSRAALLFLPIAVAALGYSIWFFFSIPAAGPYFAAITLSLLATSALMQFIPPTLLILGRSSPSTGESLMFTNFAIMPFRSVALVPGRRVGGYYLNESTQNLRTPAYARWRQQVDELEAMTRLIVLDTREVTEHVSYEVKCILDHGYEMKTLWVTDLDGSAPALDEFEQRTQGMNLVKVPITQVERVIRAFRKSLDRL